MEQFDVWFDRYAPMVYRLAQVRLRSPSLAEDVLQDVFLRLHLRRGGFRNEEHVKAWLIRVTINRASDVLRKQHDLPLSEPCPQRGEHSEVMAAVLSLPGEYRTAVHLFYYEGFSVKEIARLTKSTAGSVKTRLFRAREMLKERISELEFNAPGGM